MSDMNFLQLIFLQLHDQMFKDCELKAHFLTHFSSSNRRQSLRFRFRRICEALSLSLIYWALNLKNKRHFNFYTFFFTIYSFVKKLKQIFKQISVKDMRPKLSQKFKPDSVHCCNFYLNVFFCCENINWKKKFNTFSSCLGQYLQQTFKTGISASVVSKRGPKVNLKRNVCFCLNSHFKSLFSQQY